jgi:hypothetical protein
MHCVYVTAVIFKFVLYIIKTKLCARLYPPKCGTILFKNLWNLTPGVEVGPQEII